jgi:hypothetical protein
VCPPRTVKSINDSDNVSICVKCPSTLASDHGTFVETRQERKGVPSVDVR